MYIIAANKNHLKQGVYYLKITGETLNTIEIILGVYSRRLVYRDVCLKCLKIRHLR
jgi:hypothetical protein